jgi:hypothetical protein
MKNESPAPYLASDGRQIGLCLDSFGRVVLDMPDGRRYIGVEPVRAFPISDAGGWISFCDADGREVLCLQSSDGLAPETRALLEQELALREFVPVIERITWVSGETSPSDWEVVTDRGPTCFTLDSEEDVRRVGPHRVLITDSQKLRYQIPDSRALDRKSRRTLERFL